MRSRRIGDRRRTGDRRSLHRLLARRVRRRRRRRTSSGRTRRRPRRRRRQVENTGTVNLMSAGEPEEVDGLPGRSSTSSSTPRPTTRSRSSRSASFEEQFQIRAEGGTLDVAAVPQPGAIPDARRVGRIVSLEDMGFDIEELEATLGESFVALGEYEGEHYGIPTNINLKSMVWYPKDDFDAAGYKVPDDLRRPDRAVRPDRGRRRHAVVRRLRERGRHRLAGHRLDGGHHAPHRRSRGLRPVGRPTRSRSTTPPS